MEKDTKGVKQPEKGTKKTPLAVMVTLARTEKTSDLGKMEIYKMLHQRTMMLVMQIIHILLPTFSQMKSILIAVL